MYFGVENFVMDSATRDRIQSLHDAMHADIRHNYHSKVDPVVARYKCLLMYRHQRLTGINVASNFDVQWLRSELGILFKLSTDRYRELSSWSIVAYYQKKSLEEFGANGLIYFVEKTSRYKKSRDIGYALAIKLMSEKRSLSYAEIRNFVRSLSDKNLEVSGQTRKRGRKPVGAVAMTDAERQSRYREKRRSAGRT